MANFPTSVSTNSNLYIAVNGVQTTLAASILATDTTIQLTSTSGFPTTGYVTIDNSEVVLYTGISGANLTGCTRGADGTPAAPHSLGVTVGATIVAAHHNLLKDEVIAIETALGAGYAQASANTPNAVVKRDGSGNFSAGTITAALNGNASTATKSTNLAGGVAGAIPYQSAPDTTGFSAAGSAGDVILSGGTGAPTFNTPASAPTAGAIMKRDSNANVRVNTVIENFTTTVTAAGTTNLTAASSPIQQFTGTTTQNVVLPDATTLSIGYQISVLNRSTGSVTVKDNSGTALLTIAANSQTTFTATNISSAAGVWDASTSSGGTAVVNSVRYIVGTASGAYTGSLTVFDLPFAYIQDGKTLQVFYNGQMLSSSNYTENTTTEVTFGTALVSGSEIVFRAVAAGASASTVTFFREDYVVGTALNNYTGSLTTFNLVNPYVPGGLALAVYLDGDLQTKGATIDYQETNSLTVTFNNSLVAGQKVTFLFAQAVAPAGTVNSGGAGQLAVYPTATAQVSPLSGAPSHRNKVINGEMNIDQSNAGTASTVNAGGFGYGPDMLTGSSSGGTTGVFTLQRLGTTPPSGFGNYVRVNVTTADSSIVANDEYDLRSDIEGFTTRDLNFGTAQAQTVTLSFWVRSSLTGTYSGCIQNGGQNRSYTFEYTINSANTWEQKVISLAGDTTGTWSVIGVVGVRIRWCFATGSTYQNPAGSWAAGNFIGTSNQVNFMSSNSSRTWDLTGVQLEVGTVATPFEYRPFMLELALCQRYYEKSYGYDDKPGTGGLQDYAGPSQNAGASPANYCAAVQFKVEKRVIPTLTFYSQGGTLGSWNWVTSGGTSTLRATSGAVITTKNFNPSQSVSSTEVVAEGHWVADARL